MQIFRPTLDNVSSQHWTYPHFFEVSNSVPKKSISATCQIQNRVGLVVMCIFRVNCLKVGPNEPFKLWELRLYFSDHNETSLRKAIMAAAAPLISQMGLIQTRNHHGT